MNNVHERQHLTELARGGTHISLFGYPRVCVSVRATASCMFCIFATEAVCVVIVIVVFLLAFVQPYVVRSASGRAQICSCMRFVIVLTPTHKTATQYARNKLIVTTICGHS